MARGLIETPSARFTIPAGRFDCAVIGGGVNGAGIFRDLALRGVRVVLLEKEDFGAGTSGASSAMIHGGFRYLLSRPSVTRYSCADAGYIRKTCSHLTYRIPFVFPIIKSMKFSRTFLWGLDAALFAYDFYSRQKRSYSHCLLTAKEVKEIVPVVEADVIGAVSWDEWGINTERLCYLLVRSGEFAGGKAYNHARVDEIVFKEPQNGREGYYILKISHLIDGRSERIQARTIVNAGGPWGPLIAKLAGAEYKLRPAKGVHLLLDRRITNYAVAAIAPDGRGIFIEPWFDHTLIGTTDDDYYGDLDDIPVVWDEVKYLIEGIASIIPSIRTCRVISTWAGVRPTLFEYGKYEDKLSREHRIFDHKQQNLPGMWSVAGGKLASFRMVAEEVSDSVCDYLMVQARCRTKEVVLPGSDEEVDVNSLSLHWSVDYDVLRKMVSRHGSLVRNILVYMLKNPFSRGLVCRCKRITEAEIRYCVDEEKVTTVEDLKRRTGIGTGGCGGARCILRASALMGKIFGWTADEIKGNARSFIQKQYKRRRPAIGPLQAPQEIVSFMGY